MAYLLAFQHKKAKEKKSPGMYHEMKGGGKKFANLEPEIGLICIRKQPQKSFSQENPKPQKSEGNFPFFLSPSRFFPSFSFLVRKQCRALVISPFFAGNGRKEEGEYGFREREGKGG